LRLRIERLVVAVSAIGFGTMALPAGPIAGVAADGAALPALISAPGAEAMAAGPPSSLAPAALAATDALTRSGSGGPIITTISLPFATLGRPYQAFVAATGGTPPREFFAIPPVPPGMAILASGEIHGTPLQAGSFPFMIGVFDGQDRCDIRTLTLVVQPQFPGKVTLELFTDREAYHLFDEVHVARQVANTGPQRIADFYFGLVTPSGDVFLFYSADPLLCRQVDPEDPSTFFPLETSVTLGSKVQLDPVPFIASHLPVPLETGVYYVVAAYTDPGSTRVISNFAARGFSFF